MNQYRMNIKATLTAIEQHFAKHRQVGHTTTMLQGVKNAGPCMVVAANAQHRYQLQGLVPPSCVVRMLEPAETWMGLPPLPTVFDNYTICELCGDARREIEKQERLLQTTKLTLEQCQIELAIRNERIAKLEAQVAELSQTVGKITMP